MAAASALRAEAATPNGPWLGSAATGQDNESVLSAEAKGLLCDSSSSSSSCSSRFSSESNGAPGQRRDRGAQGSKGPGGNTGPQMNPPAAQPEAIEEFLERHDVRIEYSGAESVPTPVLSMAQVPFHASIMSSVSGKRSGKRPARLAGEVPCGCSFGKFWLAGIPHATAAVVWRATPRQHTTRAGVLGGDLASAPQGHTSMAHDPSSACVMLQPRGWAACHVCVACPPLLRADTPERLHHAYPHPVHCVAGGPGEAQPHWYCQHRQRQDSGVPVPSAGESRVCALGGFTCMRACGRVHVCVLRS